MIAISITTKEGHTLIKYHHTDDVENIRIKDLLPRNISENYTHPDITDLYINEEYVDLSKENCFSSKEIEK